MTDPIPAAPARLRLALPVALGLVTLLGLALRLWRLDALPLWLDETYSVWFSGRDWAYLWAEVPKFDTFPSFYYSVLKLWRGMFGEDEFALRLLSVVINTATIPLVALTARLCGSAATRDAAAILAGLLFACSITQFNASQDVRAYAFLTFGFALALLAAMRVMTAPDRASRPLPHLLARDPGMAAAFGGLGLGLAFMGWSHNLGLLFGACLGLGLLVWWAAARRDRALFLNLLAAAGLAVLLYAPNIPTVLMQVETLGRTGFWIPQPEPDDLARLLRQLPFGFQGGGATRAVAVWASIAAALAGLVALGRAGRVGPAALLLLLAVAPALICYGLSRVSQPIFLFRTLQPSQVPILIAMAFAPFLVPRLRHAVAGGLVLLALLAVWTRELQRTRPGDDWRQAVLRLQAVPPPVPPVVIMPAEAELPLRYYAERLAIPVDLVTVPGPYPAIGADYTYPAGGGGSPGVGPAMMPALVARLAAADRIWYLVRASALYDPQGALEATLGREFPCLLAEVDRPSLRLMARAGADGTCPAP